MPEELNFTRFTDLVLARMYEAEKDAGPMAVLDVDHLMEDFAPAVSEEWSWQAVKYLDEEGLVESFLTAQGPAHAALTPRGRIFVEREEGTGIIGEYRRSPQLIVVTGDGNQVAVGHGQKVIQAVQGGFSKEEAIELLDEAEARLDQDSSLAPEEQAELKADLAALRAQAGKKTPNIVAMQALLPMLQGTNCVADIAEKIQHLLR